MFAGMLKFNDTGLPIASQTHTSFTWIDANGNVCDLTGTTGSTVAHYEYTPFGSMAASTGEFASANPWQFSSKYYDAETQLKYYGYRYLENGRWPSRDPIEELGGENLYAFVRNSPVNSVDWLGQATAGDSCSCSASGTPSLTADIQYFPNGYHIFMNWTNFRNEGGGCYTDVNWDWWTCFWGAGAGCNRYPNANVDEDFDPNTPGGSSIAISLRFNYLSCVDCVWTAASDRTGGGCVYNRWWEPGPTGWQCQ